jgi:hypothetical protein
MHARNIFCFESKNTISHKPHFYFQFFSLSLYFSTIIYSYTQRFTIIYSQSHRSTIIHSLTIIDAHIDLQEHINNHNNTSRTSRRRERRTSSSRSPLATGGPGARGACERRCCASWCAHAMEHVSCLPVGGRAPPPAASVPRHPPARPAPPRIREKRR